MRTLIFAAVAAAALTSCKAPLPVYFDKPIGTVVDSFPKEMQGNFYPIDNIIRKGVEDLEKTYYLKEGQIVVRDTTKASVPEQAATEKVEKLATPETTPTITEENNFYKIANLNSLSVAHLDAGVDSIDRNFKIVFGYVKVNSDKVMLIIRDSLSKMHESVLFQLSKNVQLTKYMEEYYLNLKTKDGWELLKFEAWNKGEFLNIVPFYFTSYNDKTGDVMVFLNSTREIYPNLKPIYNSDHLITGLKAITDPKMIKEKFRNSENNFELLRAVDN